VEDSSSLFNSLLLLILGSSSLFFFIPLSCVIFLSPPRDVKRACSVAGREGFFFPELFHGVFCSPDNSQRCSKSCSSLRSPRLSVTTYYFLTFLLLFPAFQALRAVVSDHRPYRNPQRLLNSRPFSLRLPSAFPLKMGYAGE